MDSSHLCAIIGSIAGKGGVPYKTFLKWNAAYGIVFSTLVIVLELEHALTKN